MATKKRGSGTQDEKPNKIRSSSPKDAGAARAPKRTATSAGTARPRLRASHSTVPQISAADFDERGSSPEGASYEGDEQRPASKRAPARSPAASGAQARKVRSPLGARSSTSRQQSTGGETRSRRKPDSTGSEPRLRSQAPGAGLIPKKTKLTGPNRKEARRAALQPPAAPPEASAFARELALGLATEGIEKKAVGIEILDVTGKIDYADFLVIMTGRSDRHVQAIARGLEDAMRKKKVAALSIEGLTQATWVLIDFGDVVVHVFQEDTRAVYDIEGLWIDASRVPVPKGMEPADSFDPA